MATSREIVSEAQRLIGQSAGAGVQVYDEDGQLEILKRIFRLAFTRYPWDQFIEWRDVTLDGSTGLIEDGDIDFEDVAGLEDFLSINRDGEDTQLPKLSRKTNPSIFTGSKALVWTSLLYSHSDYATKRLKFYPVTAEDTLNIQVRIMPTITWETEIPLDMDMLVAGVAWMVTGSDDLNPNFSTTQREFMDERFNSITKALARQPVAGDGRTTVPNDWFVRP